MDQAELPLVNAARPQMPRTSTADIVRLRAPASARAVLLALSRVRGGSLVITTPTGEILRLGDDGPLKTALEICDYRALTRTARHGDIGFAQAYIDGEWRTPNLADTLTLIAANADAIMGEFSGRWLGRVWNFLHHQSRKNTRAGARRNILAHYDLGNRFYQAWLDPSMTYSSARFDLGAQTLEAAQRDKYRAIGDRLGLKRGQSVIEIGCGWGGFSEIAGRDYGARVTGLTISDAQLAFARARMARQGLSERVSVQSVDYRDARGQYDAVVSIEMFEAVGEKYWPAYFAKVRKLLKPGGRALLQIITIRDDLFETYRRRADFIQRFIFPGGMLPSLDRLRSETARAGLIWRGFDAFGESYARTLAEWARRFGDNWREIAPLGFDARFKRLWLMYLAYCEAGFRTGRTDVIQLELARAG